VVAFAVTVLVTRQHWADAAPVAATEVTFRATQPDGSLATPDDLARAQTVVGDRIAALGSSGSSVVADGGAVAAIVPGDGHEVREIAGKAARFEMRPVIRSIPAARSGAGPGSTTTAPPVPDTKRVANEKKLRQSTDRAVQLLALQYQAGRCGDDDALAGSDDPDLPLVTCSQDGTEVYLLDTSIIDGEEVADATSGLRAQSGEYVVSLEFTAAAAQKWADFTDENVGTQVAFVLDTEVVSAPRIQESITDGHTQISGSFTEQSANDLATTLDGGGLPVTLTVESAEATTLPGAEGSTPLRVGLLGTGAVLMLSVIGATTYFAMSSSRRRR
jgi:protein-export membrane protein SecD